MFDEELAAPVGSAVRVMNLSMGLGWAVVAARELTFDLSLLAEVERLGGLDEPLRLGLSGVELERGLLTGNFRGLRTVVVGISWCCCVSARLWRMWE